MTKTKSKTSGRSKGPAQQLDKRRRAAVDALGHHDRRNLIAAFRHGVEIGFPPTCAIDFHPIQMDHYPDAELAVWFKDELRNRITTWLRRRKVDWYAIWVRENYVGDRREHLHLMIHCPPRLRTDLEAAIRRWFPGDPKMVKLTALTWRRHSYSGRVACPGFQYRLKQMSTQAQGPPRRFRPTREVKSRHDGSPVAPINGLRCGVSRSLDAAAREAWMNTRTAQEQKAYSARQLALVDEVMHDP